MSNALEQKWVPSWPTSSLAHPISARCPPSRSPSFLPISPPRCQTELHVHSFSTSALIHVRAPPRQVISRFPMANPQKCQTFLQIAQPYINISISSILDSNFSSIPAPSRRQSSSNNSRPNNENARNFKSDNRRSEKSQSNKSQDKKSGTSNSTSNDVPKPKSSQSGNKHKPSSSQSSSKR